MKMTGEAQDIPLSQRDFSDLLQSISSMDERKRKLWLLIYNNALSDRQRAIEQYQDLSTIAAGNSTEQSVHARSISSFIERMSKSNDQLLKLADLVEAAQRAADDGDGEVDGDELYDKIEGRK
jgi:methyl-accepting chemotaxis protein